MRHNVEGSIDILLDDFDRQILSLLEQDSRRSISEISIVTKLSRTTIRERIGNMRDAGVIRRFTIERGETSEPDVCHVDVFIHLELRRPVCRLIYAVIRGWPELEGCWSIAGDLDMIVKLRARSTAEIERLRESLARNVEVRKILTLSILREWR